MSITIDDALCNVNCMSATCSWTERLHDFTVGLTNELPTPGTGPDKLAHQVCYNYSGIFPAAIDTVRCTKVAKGRYLFIQINGSTKDEMLTLCEVKVFAAIGK